MSYMTEVNKKMKKNYQTSSLKKKSASLKDYQANKMQPTDRTMQSTSPPTNSLKSNAGSVNIQKALNDKEASMRQSAPPSGGRKIDNGPIFRQPINAEDKRKVDPSSRIANKRKQFIRTVIRKGTDGDKRIKNTQKGNSRYGQYYTVQKAKGGHYHVYENGLRVFVKASNPLRPKKFNPKKGLNNKEYLIDA